MLRLILAMGLIWASTAQGEPRRFGFETVDITRMAHGLEEPWAIGFLPGGGFLITERGGRLLHFEASGVKKVVQGVPRVAAIGQGGLLDILVPRDFATTREIYLTLSVKQGRGAGTALARGVLSKDGRRLERAKVIFEIKTGSSGGRHFGSRLVEGRDGHLYMSVGDRGDRPSAQDLTNQNGTILRLDRAGKPVAGNPFADQGAPEVWSYGHRNPQGMAMDGRGRIWSHEHGAKGGDEINLIRKGRNYGWPVIAYGRHYSGFKIGEGTAKPGMEQPAFYWDPSIAPSGFMIYSGKLWPAWKGDLFVGSLKFDQIQRLNGSPLRVTSVLESHETNRVRDLRESPDGAIWFLSVGEGAAYRILPAR